MALLLHILVVLLFGTSPPGTARLGEGKWGSLNVTLRGVHKQSGTAPPSVPSLNNGPIGEAKQQRFGGTVRREPRALPDSPGAERLGRWSAQTEAPAARTAPTSPVVHTMPAIQASTVIAPTSADMPMPAHKPGSIEAVPLLDAPVAALPRLQSPAATVIAPPKPDLADVTRPRSALERIEAAPRVKAPTIETRSLSTSTTSPKLVSAPDLLAPLSGIEQIRPIPQLDAPPVPVTRVLSPPSERPPLHLPDRVALQPAAVLDQLKPLAGLEPTQLAPTQAPAAANTATQPTPPAAPSPSTQALPPQTTAQTLGAPNAGSSLGHDLATPPSTPPSAPRPTLNLSLPRGGEVSSRNAPGLLQLLARPPEYKSKLTQDMEKAAREDCLKAHAGAGLLAVVPLAIDTARDKGCRW